MRDLISRWSRLLRVAVKFTYSGISTAGSENCPSLIGRWYTCTVGAVPWPVHKSRGPCKWQRGPRSGHRQRLLHTSHHGGAPLSGLSTTHLPGTVQLYSVKIYLVYQVYLYSTQYSCTDTPYKLCTVHSTAVQIHLMYQVQYSCTVYRYTLYTRYSTAVHCTDIPYVPGTVQLYTVQIHLMYQVQYSCTVYRNTLYTRYSTAVHSTDTPYIPGTVQLYTVHCTDTPYIPGTVQLYTVQCTRYTLYTRYRTAVHCTVLYTV